MSAREWWRLYKIDNNKRDWIGQFPGKTLKDAVIEWSNTLNDSTKRKLDLDAMTFEGSKIVGEKFQPVYRY